MTSSIRVLTAASIDSSPSLLLVAPDGSKILIDCGEGCQRAFIEYSQKVSSVQCICLTQLCNDSIGGLPGLLLTLSDILALNDNDDNVASSTEPSRSWPFHPLINNDTAHVHLFGPEGSVAYLRTLRHFMRRSKFKLRVYEGTTESAAAVPKVRKEPKINKKVQQPEPATFSVISIPFEEQIIDDRVRRHVGQKRPHREVCRKTVSYLFTTPPLVGKFLPQKAQELGVPRGSLYGQLKAGQSVTFIHTATQVETTVHSYQVVTPASPGIAVFFIRYPQSPDKLEDFFASLDITERLTKAVAKLDVVVHLAFANVFCNAVAKEWRTTQLDPEVQHLWMDLGAELKSPHRSAETTANIRAALCPQIFRPLHCSTKAPPFELDDCKVCAPGLEFRLLPRSKLGLNPVAFSASGDDEMERMKDMEESGAKDMAQDIIRDQVLESSHLGENGKGDLLFAGTASALPCKYRNVTGMLLSNVDGRSMLLDVGEGTVGQLLRMQAKGRDMDRLISSITAVWVSHPHADHHLGLLRLLEQREATEPLLLIAPPPIFRFLQEYSATIDPRISHSFREVDCRTFQKSDAVAVAEFQKAVGFANCRAIQVEHCPYSYAVILDGTPFGRVVYSGDCRPCAKLAEMAKPTDLLIHECTFEDSMKSEAFLKKHCTIGEALGIAKAMDAKCTVLTHFSQRYPRIPPPTNVVDTTGMCIIFAFDFQILTPGTLLLAASLTPALRKLYPDEGDDDVGEISEAKAKVTLSTPGLFANAALL